MTYIANLSKQELVNSFKAILEFSFRSKVKSKHIKESSSTFNSTFILDAFVKKVSDFLL